MYEQAPIVVGNVAEDLPTSDDIEYVDVVVIGAGLGGLLSAAQLLQQGKRVVILERLSHSGGRFTAKTFHGVQVSTGAVHMVPFGSSGVLAGMLRRLQVPHRFFDADVFGSFHVHGKQYRTRGLLGVYKFLGPYQFFWFTRIGYLMFFRPLPLRERDLPFNLWLERHLNAARNPQLVALFERISRFALSLELSQVSTAEVVRITKNMLRYGAPAIVQGGCGELTRQLEQHIIRLGGEIRLSCDVLQIIQQDGRVTGVRVRDKTNNKELQFAAPVVVSDIGSHATDALLQSRRITQAELLKQHSSDVENNGPEMREAVGLKVHILSDISLIPHKGIMYCLDTQRIAGIVQPTNSDPALAPEGKHLLISHQVIQSDNIEEERALALADLRQLFGEQFEKHCQVLTMSAYRGAWPVNRSVQGEDAASQTQVKDLYLVGDAVKPAGYLMVEGVAQSVNRFLDILDERQRGTLQKQGNVNAGRPVKWEVKPPSRLGALRWLWKAPGNAGKS